MERTENVERLLNTVEKLGFSEQVKEQVKEHMAQGLSKFEAYESLKMGDNKIDYQLNFDVSKKNDDGKVYLNTIDTLRENQVRVPHTVVLGVDTTSVETLIKNKPLGDNVHPGNLNDFETELYDHRVRVETKMEFLKEHAPEVYNALQVKYHLELPFEISAEMKQQQEMLQQGLVKYNSFSTYFNLTALEMYNALDGGAALKQLFKTKGDKEVPAPRQEEGAEKDNKYKSWVQIDPEVRRADGSHEMKLFHENRNFNLRQVLADFNLSETNDRYSRIDVIRFLEKGSQVKVTNLNTAGEKELLIRANPEFKTIDLFKVNGQPISSPKPYLKQALQVEVGAVVELKKWSDQGRPQTKQETITQEVTAEKADRKSVV